MMKIGNGYYVTLSLHFPLILSLCTIWNEWMATAVVAVAVTPSQQKSKREENRWRRRRKIIDIVTLRPSTNYIPNKQTKKREQIGDKKKKLLNHRAYIRIIFDTWKIIGFFHFYFVVISSPLVRCVFFFRSTASIAFSTAQLKEENQQSPNPNQQRQAPTTLG